VKKELIAEIKRKHLNQVVQAHLSKIRNAKGIEMNGQALRNLIKPSSPAPLSAEDPPAVNVNADAAH
jgi:hypothetical protein